MKIIAPSLLAADFLNLENELNRVSNCGATWLHLDVMDGHFVPNLTFGYELISNLRKKSDLFFDVHLMISNPTEYIESYAKAGSEMLTIHYEAFSNEEDLIKCIDLIKSFDVKVGLSIKLETNVTKISKFLPQLDMALVMSVAPGFGGQSFNPLAIDKISQLNQIRDENGYNYIIQVDGGINNTTARLCSEVGCDCLVAGSYLFNGDMKHLVTTLV